MNFDHLDDSESFVADPDLRSAVLADGQVRRRRSQHRRLAVSSCTALVLIASVVGFGAWATSRVDRVHVGFSAPPVDLSAPFNVLIIGSDGRSGEPAPTDNADAVMVVRIDPTTARISVLSIPRDLAIEGADGPRVAELLRGDPDRLAKTIQRELGIPLSAYVGISFKGLVSIADAFGGLDVAITKDVTDAFSGMDLRASSCTRLNGEQLLAALRSRRPIATTEAGSLADTSSDIGRRERQRALIALFFSQSNRLTARPDALDRIAAVAIDDLEVDDRLDLTTMMAVAKWFSSTTVDVVVDDLPTEWTTGQNQRRVLVVTPQSSPKITEFTSDAMTDPHVSAQNDGVIQPFTACA